LFAAATQGYFIAKSRRWESGVLLVIAFMLFRPDFFLDQVSEKYASANGPAATELMGNQATGSDMRLIVSGPDFDTGDVRTTTVVVPAIAGDAEAALAEQGLTILEEGGQLLMEEPFPGTTFFETLGNEYDFYGDTPVTVSTVQVENDRMPKEIFFLPAFLLLGGLVLIQRRRATQPAF
jgi:hypothetical protein